MEYCRTCLEASKIYTNTSFWRAKAKAVLDVTSKEFDDNTLRPARPARPARRYLQLLTQKGGIAIQSCNFLDLDDYMKRAIRQDHTLSIDYGISVLKFDDWDIPLYEYARKNDSDTVMFLLKFLPNYQLAAEGALKGGHRELFNRIRILANSDYRWYNFDLAKSAIRNLELFKYVVSLIPIAIRDWSYLANAAIRKGQFNVFIYIQSLAPPSYQWDWNFLLEKAVIRNDRKLFSDILQLVNGFFDPSRVLKCAIKQTDLEFVKSILGMVTYNWDWKKLAVSAVRASKIEIFDYFCSLTTFSQYQWHEFMNAAIESKNVNIIKHIQSIVQVKWNWLSLANSAIAINSKNIFDYIRNLAGNDYIWDWDFLMATAVKSNCIDLFTYIRSLAPVDHKYRWNHLAEAAIKSKQTELFDYIWSIAPADHPRNWTYLCGVAITIGLNMFDYVRSQAPADLEWDYIARLAIINTDLFDYVYALAPKDYQWNYNNLRDAVSGNQQKMDHIRSLAPPNYEWLPYYPPS